MSLVTSNLPPPDDPVGLTDGSGPSDGSVQPPRRRQARPEFPSESGGDDDAGTAIDGDESEGRSGLVGRLSRKMKRFESGVVGKRSPGARPAVEDESGVGDRMSSPAPPVPMPVTPSPVLPDSSPAPPGPELTWVDPGPDGPPHADSSATPPADLSLSVQAADEAQSAEADELPRLRRPPTIGSIEIDPDRPGSAIPEGASDAEPALPARSGAWVPDSDDLAREHPPNLAAPESLRAKASVIGIGEETRPEVDAESADGAGGESGGDQEEPIAGGEPRRRSAHAPAEPKEREGLRTRRRTLRKEQRRKVGAFSAGAVASVAAAVAIVAIILLGAVVVPELGGGNKAPETKTLLVVQTDEARPEAGAVALTLFGLSDNNASSIVFLPPGTSSEIPSQGPDRLGDAILLSNASLTRLAVENLMGIRVDSMLVLNSAGMREFFDPLGPVKITVGERLTAREGDLLRTRFTPGTFDFDAAKLVEYLNFRGDAESDIQRLTRHQRVWDGVLDRAKSDGLGEAMIDRLAEVQLAQANEVAALGELITKLSKSERGYALLPVDPKQALDNQESYEPRIDDIQSMVNQRFAGARPKTGSDRIRIGILNGNGNVGVTEAVALQLVPEGYRVIYTENADRFDYPATQIVFYRTPFEDQAREIQGRMGTGELVYNRSPQDVVDIVIIVGSDYPPKGK